MLRLTLEGEVGPLEAIVDVPDGPPAFAVLLCHPHPPSGGTMNTHAVFRAMRALRSLGCTVLRFNYRGVGRSAGTLGDGEGEMQDGRTAFAWLKQEYPALPKLAGGFSFGSWVGMNVGVEGGAHGLLGLGAPYRGYDFSAVEKSPSPKAWVLADRDEFTTVASMELALTAIRDPKRLWIVEGTTHLFTERLDAYEAVVRDAGQWLLDAAPRTRGTP